MKKALVMGILVLASVSSHAMDRQGLEKCIEIEMKEIAKNPGLADHADLLSTDEDNPAFDHVSAKNVLWNLTDAMAAKNPKIVSKIKNTILLAKTCHDLFDPEKRKNYEYQYSYYLKESIQGLKHNKRKAEGLGLKLVAETLKPEHFYLTSLIEKVAAGRNRQSKDPFTLRKQAEEEKKLLEYKGMTADAAEEKLRQRVKRTVSDLTRAYAEDVEKIATVVFGTTAAPVSVQVAK